MANSSGTSGSSGPSVSFGNIGLTVPSTSSMMGLHHSNSNPEGATMPSPSASVVGNRARDIAQQNLTNVTMMSFRQQMDESNHEMVNTLTSQLGTILNPLINNTNDNYQLLAHQMGRIADFFGTPA
ncbi:hypothetical protein L195_g060749, partial [Trifolium pratense]